MAVSNNGFLHCYLRLGQASSCRFALLSTQASPARRHASFKPLSSGLTVPSRWAQLPSEEAGGGASGRSLRARLHPGAVTRAAVPALLLEMAAGNGSSASAWRPGPVTDVSDNLVG